MRNRVRVGAAEGERRAAEGGRRYGTLGRAGVVSWDGMLFDVGSG
jgi:hypothetical protein